jgi:hypothetical protein
MEIFARTFEIWCRIPRSLPTAIFVCEQTKYGKYDIHVLCLLENLALRLDWNC